MKNIIWALIWAFVLTVVICAVVTALMGCSINSSTEKVEANIKLPAGQVIEFVSSDGRIAQTKLLQDQIVPVVYFAENWQGLFLYYTDTKGIYRETPFSTCQVGRITSVPDANSIEAVSTGATKLGLKAFTGI